MGRTEIVEPIDIVSGDYIFSLFLSFVAIITNYNFREGASAGVGFWKHETSAACVCVKRERERESVCVCVSRAFKIEFPPQTPSISISAQARRLSS